MVMCKCANFPIMLISIYSITKANDCMIACIKIFFLSRMCTMKPIKELSNYHLQMKSIFQCKMLPKKKRKNGFCLCAKLDESAIYHTFVTSQRSNLISGCFFPPLVCLQLRRKQVEHVEG